jgi:hypothetical protein
VLHDFFDAPVEVLLDDLLRLPSVFCRKKIEKTFDVILLFDLVPDSGVSMTKDRGNDWNLL